MAYVSSDLSVGDAASPSQSGLMTALKSARVALATYVAKRRIYLRTLTELQSYSRRDLLDLGIDPDALHAFSRRAAGL